MSHPNPLLTYRGNGPRFASGSTRTIRAPEGRCILNKGLMVRRIAQTLGFQWSDRVLQRSPKRSLSRTLERKPSQSHHRNLDRSHSRNIPQTLHRPPHHRASNRKLLNRSDPTTVTITTNCVKTLPLTGITGLHLTPKSYLTITTTLPCRQSLSLLLPLTPPPFIAVRDLPGTRIPLQTLWRTPTHLPTTLTPRTTTLLTINMTPRRHLILILPDLHRTVARSAVKSATSVPNLPRGLIGTIHLSNRLRSRACQSKERPPSRLRRRPSACVGS